MTKTKSKMIKALIKWGCYVPDYMKDSLRYYPKLEITKLFNEAITKRGK